MQKEKVRMPATNSAWGAKLMSEHSRGNGFRQRSTTITEDERNSTCTVTV